MGDIKAIDTIYDGYKFRSRLEARWAVFFNEMGIDYEYELDGMILSDGTYYLPDFYLPGFHVFFEVKARHLLGTKEGDEAIRKISDGMRTNSWAGLIAFGDPMDDKMFLYCQETDDSGGGSYEHEVHFGHFRYGRPLIHDSAILISEDSRVRFFYDRIADDNNFIDIYTDGAICALSCGEFEHAMILRGTKTINAAEKARQTRFEHGETPKGGTTR